MSTRLQNAIGQMERLAIVLPKNIPPTRVQEAWFELKAAIAELMRPYNPLQSLEHDCPKCGARLAYVPPFQAFRNPKADAEALERARVVAVLDGWAEDGSCRWHRTRNQQTIHGGAWECHLYHPSDRDWPIEGKVWTGPTPDAARAAAAKAIEEGSV